MYQKWMWNGDKFKVKTLNGGCLISYQQIEEFSRLVEHTFFPGGILNGNNFKYFMKVNFRWWEMWLWL